MNSLSVSRKNWILKKYNQEDIIFFKENFSLDEITSKLLSIRNIKKNEVKGFLNPSIKNFLPMQDGDVAKTEADLSLLEEWVNFRPQTSIKTGISNFVDWYKSYYS